MQEFMYIRASGDRDSKSAIESVYSRSDLLECLVIRNENTNKYQVIPKKDVTVALTKTNSSLHEVIFGWSPQKLKFDIDAYESDIPEDIDLLDELKKAVYDEYFASYFVNVEEDIDDDDFFVTKSHGGVVKDGKVIHKISYHILIAPTKFAVASNDEAIAFTNRIKVRLPPEIMKCIDFGVNKNLQNFRILNTCKLGTTRRLTYEKGAIREYTKDRDDNIFKTSLVTYCDNLRILPSLIDGDKPTSIMIDANITLEDKVLNRAIKVATEQGFTEGFELRETRHNMILFDRIAPSMCKICKEVHHKDNTLILFIASVEEYSNTKALFAKCRHHEESLIIEVMMPTIEDIKSKDRKRFNMALKYRSEAENIDELASINRYNDSVIHDFPLSRTLFVKAQMKMGKTNALKRFIQTHFPKDGLVEPVIRVISFRKSFGTEFLSKFQEEGFVLYTELEGNISHPRVIVQAESMFRLMTSSEPIDLLILDESESIFDQIDSGLHNQFGLSFAAFNWMLRTAKHVVCMDALLGNRTYNIIKQIRGTEDAHFECNEFQKAADDKYYFTTNLSVWLSNVFKAIENDENIVINSSSLIELETVRDMIEAKHPDISIGMYTSKTLNSLKKKHFADVNNYWSQYQILMVTPTVSAGISFEREHYDRVFGYFTDFSCNTETCIQMLGRVRNVKTREYCICINDAGHANMPIDRDEIKRLLYTRHRSIINEIDTKYLTFYYDNQGNVAVHNSDYFAIWLENTVVRHSNRRSFYGRFMHYIRESGALVEFLCEDEVENSSHYEELLGDHDITLDSIKHVNAYEIASADDINEEEAQAINKNIKEQNDVTCEDVNKLSKFRLRKFYKNEEIMSAKYVRTYNNSIARQQYKNLCALKDVGDDPNALTMALQSIKEDEKLRKDTLPDYVENKFIESQRGKSRVAISRIKQSIIDALDLSYRYQYDKLRISCEILAICGWDTPFSSNIVDEMTLFTNIKNNYEGLLACKSKIAMMFEINWNLPKEMPTYIADLSRITTVINRLIKKCYDIAITKMGKSKYDVSAKYVLQSSRAIFSVVNGEVNTTVV